MFPILFIRPQIRPVPISLTFPKRSLIPSQVALLQRLQLLPFSQCLDCKRHEGREGGGCMIHCYIIGSTKNGLSRNSCDTFLHCATVLPLHAAMLGLECLTSWSSHNQCHSSFLLMRLNCHLFNKASSGHSVYSGHLYTCSFPSQYISHSYFFLKCYLFCVCVNTYAMACRWKSEDNLWCQHSPATFTWVLGIKLRLPDLHTH